MEGAAVDKRNLNVLPEPFASSDLSLKGIETDVAFDDVLLREKVVIVGDEGVGKTSIVKSFLKKDDKLYGKTYVMTKGLDVEVSEVAVPNTNIVVDLFLFDIAKESAAQYQQESYA